MTILTKPIRYFHIVADREVVAIGPIRIELFFRGALYDGCRIRAHVQSFSATTGKRFKAGTQYRDRRDTSEIAELDFFAAWVEHEIDLAEYRRFSAQYETEYAARTGDQ